jgi:hypothetical protein
MRDCIFEICAAALMIVVSAGGGWAQTQPPKSLRPAAIVITPPSRPVPIFTGDDSPHAIYEIALTNYDRRVLKIDQLALAAKPVEGCAGVSISYQGEDLSAVFSNVSADRSKPQQPLLKPGASATLFLMQDFSGLRCAPATVTNSIVVESADHSAARQLINAPETTLDHSAPIVVSAPIRGDNWWSGNGPSNFSDHRRAVVVIDGVARFAQRYAEDWIMLDGRGHSFGGDKSRNQSYHCYGQPVLAVADGTIVEVRDGIVENTPAPGWDPPLPPVVPIDLDTVAGNHIVENLGGGRYALYAHLIPGSTKLRPGDKVARGAPIGKVGNSGNSTEPHLHFQIMDGPSPLGSSGVPFAIDRFIRYSYNLKYQAKDHPFAMTIGSRTAVSGQSVMNGDLGSY